MNIEDTNGGPVRLLAKVGALAAAVGIGGMLGGLGTASADPDSSAGEASAPAEAGNSAARVDRGRGHPVRAGKPSVSAPIADSEADVRGAQQTRRPARSGPEPTAAQVDIPRRDSSPTEAARSVPVVAEAPPVTERTGPATPELTETPTGRVSARSVTYQAAPEAVVAVGGAASTPVAPPQTFASRPASIGGVEGAAPSPLLGTGRAVPVESPLGWAVLAVSRRLGRVGEVRRPAAAATATTAGTTTSITWGWGTNPVLSFNPNTDRLDFGWMQAGQFDVTEKAGSTQIAIVGNNHSYTLANVPISQLQISNIVAKDAGTVSKWQSLIAGATTTLPTVSIANAAVAEGNSGTKGAVFTVTLSKATDKTVTVGYSTGNGTATAGSDYTGGSGTLSFAPGVTSQKINVTVTGDTAVEPTETFTVRLAAVTNAKLGTSTATGTITNDDVAPSAAPTISIANSAVTEGNSGTTTMAFTVTLSKTTDKAVTVSYSTANGTATAGQDYTSAGGTLTFAAGATTQKVNVVVAGDTTVEPTETFTVALANPTNGTLAVATAVGTITNDDTTTPPTTTDRWGKSFYAPYADMGGWPVPDLLAISRANGGGSLFTAAFMQATPDGKLAWAGLNALEPGASNDQAQAINRSIKALQTAGGDVMISLGGQAGTSLAQWGSTHGMTAAQLANAYANVVDTYSITHLDFDIEGAAVADPSSIALNSQALKVLQQSKPQLKIWYTLPVLPTGLTADGLKVVDSALKAGVTLAGINVMAMDYGESAAPTSGSAAKTMGAYAIASAESTYAQLAKLYSGYGKSFGYSQLGVTPMLGVNDVTTEVFTLADAQSVEDYARAKGLGMVALWSVTRDTPGPLGVSTYTHSGLGAPAGSFARIFNDYGTANALTYGTAGSPSGGTTSGPTTPVTGGTTTTVAWHWGASTVVSFNTATDKLDFGWMQPTSFELSEKAGSTVITIVNNNQAYTLAGVPLRTMQMGNIVALDANTLAKWQAAISTALTTRL